jgi:ribonuclease HII
MLNDIILNIILFLLLMKIKYNDSFNIEAGLDEAGRGPLIGRVYAAAVNWGDTPINENVMDSKKLSAKKRAIVLEWIKENVDEWAVGFAEPQEIDSINILEATKLAMDRALNQFQFKPDNLIIDGIGWEKKFLKYKVTSIVKGDANYYSIAAASIIAKEYHDDYIKTLCNQHPELNERYDLLNNMGYGTKKHIEGIQKYGLSDFHRKTFKIKLKN